MRRAGSRSRGAGALAAAVTPAAFSVLAALTSSCDLTVSLNNLGGGCPPAAHGPTMIKVAGAEDAGPARSYCIDSTEVTNAQYAEFVASKFTIAQAAIPGASDAGASCGSVTSTAPGDGTYGHPGDDAFPVANVNWCQAYAYCKWAGKRLCGEIHGGALSTQYFETPAESQWFNACSAGGARPYPYGETFIAAACGIGGNGSNVVNVASRSTCVGGFSGIHDMCGNVWEWTDTCQSADPGAFCYAMGGGFDSTQPDLQCNGQRNWTRTSGAANIGIRCCMDL